MSRRYDDVSGDADSLNCIFLQVTSMYIPRHIGTAIKAPPGQAEQFRLKISGSGMRYIGTRPWY